MRFEKKCTKANGELRRTFSQWQVPKSIRRQNRLHDGDICYVSLQLNDFYYSFKTVLTSGLEIYLPKVEATKLRVAAEVTNNPVIIFKLSLCITLDEVNGDLDHKIAEAHRLSDVEVLQLALQAPLYPEKKTVTTTAFNRSPYVIVAVLNRAKGICEKCKRSAPFRGSKDKTPYLEVHHAMRLADGGADSLDNALALCPNCHREIHYG